MNHDLILTLNQRQLCDLELILNDGFSPLNGFMNRADYERVLKEMRLTDGTLWPMPIVLDIPATWAEQAKSVNEIFLQDHNGFIIACMDIKDCWQPDKVEEASVIYGTTDTEHPGVNYLLNHAGSTYIGGPVRSVRPPMHYDFPNRRHTPAELKQIFKQRGWQRIVGFQTRNPMHKAHYELTFRAAREAEANLLIHPVVGPTQHGDIDYPTRVRCYEALMPHYPEQTTILSLLPLAMRMAGPREALWHAIIRKNYGCTHFIVGRDHASPSVASQQTFYTPYAAQELVLQHQQEIGIEIIPFPEMVYDEDRAQYVGVDKVKPHEKVLKISGTELRERLREEIEIPTWFSFPEVIAELRRTYPPKYQRGFCVFFTGLSGAGKSVLANALHEKLAEIGGRTITLLDGDEVRRKLSTELGFSKHDRDLNVLRQAYIVTEICKHRGIAICATIAPYHDTRDRVRKMIKPYGGFVEVYVSTPIEVCEQRDRKGLYAKARAGEIKEFTGISDPYEAPEHPELIINTNALSPDEAVQKILLKLENLGYLKK